MENTVVAARVMGRRKNEGVDKRDKRIKLRDFMYNMSTNVNKVLL